MIQGIVSTEETSQLNDEIQINGPSAFTPDVALGQCFWD